MTSIPRKIFYHRHSNRMREISDRVRHYPEKALLPEIVYNGKEMIFPSQWIDMLILKSYCLVIVPENALIVLK